MAPDNIAEISSLLIQELAQTEFQCDELHPRSGGHANYVFRGRLTTPLADGTSEVLIKHGEGYQSTNRAFELPTSRCTIESACLSALQDLPPAQPNPWCVLRTPRVHHFNAATNTQIQEYLPHAIDLKNYALKRYGAPTPAAQRAQCLGIGSGLGRWLRGFHDWAAREQAAALRESAARNRALQRLKHFSYYEHLVTRLVDAVPDVLGAHGDVLRQIARMAEQELEDDAALQVVHGDFWTGNVLLPDAEIGEPTAMTMFIVDWEVVSLGIRERDIGQMLAELYQLKLYEGIDAGLWLMEGFLGGYGSLSREAAFRTAIHVGCHLVVIGGSVYGWGSAENNKRVVAFGRDVMLSAWRKDEAWFEGRPLHQLFRS
ncbi:kinase-like domain-containing protein [Lasiosphaeria miniovina]|uniref:Kinase-like domain-containing protein n=1 Tax=Lasiosphaeria miniovina TaxID=1954250 RepID=A0AA40BF32_9PEZI|nr:kinase-like domain-containing protein [Lasiosphaeria miniovina]KAK0733080.1 kinase-like domain-containing protein [Lasiosphaeria miniovina]